MKSEWRVAHIYAGGYSDYQVYRLRDVNAVDHSGNREYRGGCFDHKEDAESYADELNRWEETNV